MRKYSMLFLFALIFCTSCKKNERSQTDTPNTINKMTGRIVWPANLNLDTTGVKVSTFHSAASIKENGFIVDTINKFSTVFVTDSKGDVKMMRYNYPGQKDNDISINSTALALIMNAPIVTSLSDEGQLAMINKIQLDSNFPSLVDEIKNAITLNKSIIDTTNTSLILATSKLFESASRYRLNTYRPVPLNIKTANPGTFSFANNNVSHKYVIGIYKNNGRIEKLVVNGTQSFAASFKDVIDGVFGNGYSSPDSKIFSTAEDGTLEFRIRSGAPGTDDNSTEYKEAFKENIVEYIFTLVKSKMPLDSKCTKNAYDGIKSTIESTQAFSKASTPADFASTALGFCSDLFNTRASLFEDCSNYKDPNYKNPYWIAAGKFFKFFDKVGKVGQGLNIGMHVYDLYNSRAAIDTCFEVLDKKVGTCIYSVAGWYKGTYTIGVSGDDYCGNDFGKKGSFYLYIGVNDKRGGLIKSFNSTFPDLLNNLNGPIIRWSDGTVSCELQGGIANSSGGISGMELPLIVIRNGKMSTTNYGRAIYSVDTNIRPGKCPSAGISKYDFYYPINQLSGEFFHATSPPPELMQSEVQSILNTVQ
ncbi:hypothetical protein [Lacibacter sp. H407]|uniref:hypothetical protein n=1 Tax=Lacibacter sp. H407 TaxID=3133423 RepID=UPI0030BE1BB2